VSQIAYAGGDSHVSTLTSAERTWARAVRSHTEIV
jgi:hypothetical protein